MDTKKMSDMPMTGMEMNGMEMAGMEMDDVVGYSFDATGLRITIPLTFLQGLVSGTYPGQTAGRVPTEAIRRERRTDLKI